jgi:hypothetical protein
MLLHRITYTRLVDPDSALRYRFRLRITEAPGDLQLVSEPRPCLLWFIFAHKMWKPLQNAQKHGKMSISCFFQDVETNKRSKPVVSTCLPKGDWKYSFDFYQFTQEGRKYSFYVWVKISICGVMLNWDNAVIWYIGAIWWIELFDRIHIDLVFGLWFHGVTNCSRID